MWVVFFGAPRRDDDGEQAERTQPHTRNHAHTQHTHTRAYTQNTNSTHNAPVEPAKGAIVERQPQQAHVVGVEHAVREADALPAGDEAGRAAADLAKEVGGEVDALVFFSWWLLLLLLCVRVFFFVGGGGGWGGGG